MKTNQAATTFSTSDHYTAKTGRFTDGRRGWAYQGTLYRNGAKIATYQAFGDGHPMRVMFSGAGEEEALRAWFETVEPERCKRDRNYDIGAPVESIVMTSDNEAQMRKTMLKKVFWCVPGDVRNGGKSTFYEAKPVAGIDLMTAAKQVQQESSDAVVLNLLPFDAGYALYATLSDTDGIA